MIHFWYIIDDYVSWSQILNSWKNKKSSDWARADFTGRNKEEEKKATEGRTGRWRTTEILQHELNN